jgi:hypothetical protein
LEVFCQTKPTLCVEQDQQPADSLMARAL